MTQRKPIISARRTDTLEDLLQKLWTLRPIYKNKHAFTITAGVAALIREIEQTDLILGRQGTATPQPSAKETEVGGRTEAVEERAVATAEGLEQQVSDDVEWA